MYLYLNYHGKRIKIGELLDMRGKMHGIFNSKYKAINYMKFANLNEVAPILVDCYDMPETFSLEIAE